MVATMDALIPFHAIGVFTGFAMAGFGMARYHRRTREASPGTHVTVVLPRRSYALLAGRLLHDHTADRIARVVSHVPGAAASSTGARRSPGWSQDAGSARTAWPASGTTAVRR